MQKPMTASIQFNCSDQVGLIAALANFFLQRDVNITHNEEAVCDGQFFSRIEWVLDDQWKNEAQFKNEFDELVKKYSASFSVRFNNVSQTIGLLVSHHSHTLLEVINKFETNYFENNEICFIIGNDDSIQKIADRHAIPFFYISSNLEPLACEEKQLEIINRYSPDYLGQFSDSTPLSANFLQNVSCPVIGVHNSFLPMFNASDSYQLAFNRGVKLIGATSYFVVAELDQGPIIEQGVLRVAPGASMQEFVKIGHHVERNVFSHALHKVLQHKVMVFQKRAMVFK